MRQQRVAAVIALREMEYKARAEGTPLYDDLQAKMDAVHGCSRLEGTGERHVRLLPSRPMFEARAPPHFPQIGQRRCPTLI